MNNTVFAKVPEPEVVVAFIEEPNKPAAHLPTVPMIVRHVVIYYTCYKLKIDRERWHACPEYTEFDFTSPKQ